MEDKMDYDWAKNSPTKARMLILGGPPRDFD